MIVFTHEWLHTLSVSVVLEVSNVDDGTTELNMSKIEHNKSEVSLWVIDRVLRIYSCNDEVCNIEGIDGMFGVDGCELNDSFDSEYSVAFVGGVL